MLLLLSFTALWLGGLAEASRSDTLLADAAERADAVAAQGLLRQGHPVDERQADGMTALHWAVYHDDQTLTRLLLEAGADCRAANRYGVAPLSTACVNGNAEIVERLLKAGADPETTLPGGETALMTAARTGRLKPVQALLDRKVNLDARERSGQTALMWAAAEGNLEVVDALLKAGADYQTPLASGFTPLFFAVREGETAVALRLLETGLDVNASMQRGNDRRGPNPLLLAVENGHFETALALVEAGADPNAQPEGHAALHAMSWVRKPIRGDGDPSPVGSGNIGPLQFVRELVARGADVDVRLGQGQQGFADFTTTGSTPFVLAARTGDLPLMQTLLELEANPQLTNADSTTALLAAAGVGDLGSGRESAGTEQEAMEAISLLLDLGLDINAVDENGETAMHAAAYQNRPRLIRFLAEHNAQVEIWNRRNKWGWTPLMIARGYRKGNFRPDVATIAAIEKAMRNAGVEPPTKDQDVEANQQSWDRKKPEQPRPPQQNDQAPTKAKQKTDPKSKPGKK